MPEGSNPQNNNLRKEAATLAAALIRSDFQFLLGIYPILVLPQILGNFVLFEHTAGIAILFALSRSIEVGLLFVVTRRLFNKLSLAPKSWSFQAFGKFLFVGFFIWLLLILPGIPAMIFERQNISFALHLLLVLPGLFCWYRYYFYFVPLGASQDISIKEALSSSASFINADPFLPFRTLVAPIGVWLFLTSLPFLPYPDGRDLTFVIAADILSGSFWVLSTYLSLAFAIIYIGDPSWRLLGLDPYRTSRIDTLKHRAPPLITKILSPKGSFFVLLALGIPFWLINLGRLLDLPPAPEITLISASALNNQVQIVLDLKDEKYKYRGFQPLNFHLAGEKESISRNPDKATVEGLEGNRLLSLYPAKDPVKLTLAFTTSRSGRALLELEDLFLWYKGVKITQVRLSPPN